VCVDIFDEIFIGRGVKILILSSMTNFEFLDRKPSIHATAFIAPSADIIGDVTVGEEASIWYAAVLRGDINRIVIGARSNIQDGCVVHLADDYPTLVGEYVTVGHKAVLHACRIDDEVLVGMGAIILDGATIGARSIIGAGALVTGGTEIPPGSLVLGSPGKVVKTLDQDAQKSVRGWAEKYVEVARRFRERESSGV
jgi:carbonic anhydrase/acetyltransferase-like protein (isoleucine patch superfamily)